VVFLEIWVGRLR